MTDDEYEAETMRYVKEKRDALSAATGAGPYPMRIIARASLLAEQSAQQDGLHPRFDKVARDWIYRPEQGIRAAHHAREDAAATLTVTHELLRNQQIIKRLLWAILALLLIVISKLS